MDIEVDLVHSRDVEDLWLESVSELLSIYEERNRDRILKQQTPNLDKEWYEFNNPIEEIKQADLTKKPLDIIFKGGSGYRVDDIRLALFNKLNKYKSITDLYVKITFQYEKQLHYRIYCLSNEDARKNVFTILPRR